MAPKSPKVVVVGASYVDLALRSGVVPQKNGMYAGSELSYTVTGPGPDQAVEAALCGCDVKLISKIGDDPFNHLVIQTLAEHNVDTKFVYFCQGKKTGIIVTLVNDAGETLQRCAEVQTPSLTAADIHNAEQVIADADVCLIHGCLPTDAVSAAIKTAKIHGTKTILDPAIPIDKPYCDPVNLPDEYFTADVLIPNLHEAAEITENSDALKVRWDHAKIIGSEIVSRGVTAVVITMEKRGAMVIDRSGADHIPAFEVELVDHTAKGDAFAGALAAYLAVGDDIREAVKFANAAAALVCTKFGSMEALPDKHDIIQLLQREDIDRKSQ